jgi:AraC family transcriptional activator of pobA
MNLTKSKIKFNSFTKPLDDQDGDNLQQNIVGYISLENDSSEYFNFTRRFFTFSLLHIFNGTGNFVQNETKYDINSNSVYFAYPGHVLSPEKLLNLNAVILYCSPDFLLSCNKNFIDLDLFQIHDAPLSAQLTIDESKELKEVENKIIFEIENNHRKKEELLKTLISQHVFLVERDYFKNDKPVSDKKLPELVKRFIALMNINQNFTLSLSDLADTFNVSSNHLNALIKKYTNKPVKSHIKDKMITQAKNLLIHSDFEIKEIAYTLGFNYPQYFNRAFKQSVGITPGEFRLEFAY